MSVLIEALRREGYEFEVGRPQVITKEKNGETLEPMEELIIEVPAEHVGSVQMELGNAKSKSKRTIHTAQRGTQSLYIRFQLEPYWASR